MKWSTRPEDWDAWEIEPGLKARMIEFARELRQRSTTSERMLWAALRNRQLDGYKFRREQPIGPFILDFYCASARLAVEVDGEIHALLEYEDAARQMVIERLGIRFVRVTAQLLERDLASTIQQIRTALQTE